MYLPKWQVIEPLTEQAAPDQLVDSNTSRFIFLLELAQDYSVAVAQQWPRVTVKRLMTQSSSAADTYQTYVKQLVEQLKLILQDSAIKQALVQVVYPVSGNLKTAGFNGLGALLKTVALENPKINGQLIQIEKQVTEKVFIDQLIQATQLTDISEFKFVNNKIQQRVWSQLAESVERERVAVAWRESGVYLITGGLGGIGYLVAKNILQDCPTATVVLVGRTELNKHSRVKLAQLNNPNAIYYSADCQQIRCTG